MAQQRRVAGLSMSAAPIVRHALAPDRGGADADPRIMGYTLRQQRHGERQQGSVTGTMTGRETHQ